VFVYCVANFGISFSVIFSLPATILINLNLNLGQLSTLRMLPEEIVISLLTGSLILFWNTFLVILLYLTD